MIIQILEEVCKIILHSIFDHEYYRAVRGVSVINYRLIQAYNLFFLEFLIFLIIAGICKLVLGQMCVGNNSSDAI